MSDTDGVPCPKCGTGLPLGARFCWKCEDYLEDMLTAGERTAYEEGKARTRAEMGLPDDRLEDVIQEAGRKALELLGFKVYSLNQDRATRQTPGIADTYVAGHGRTTWAEWKRPGEVQSADQFDFEKNVVENGAEYHVWMHENDAIAWAEDAMKPPANRRRVPYDRR